MFDRYIRYSLKGRSQHKRAGGKEVRYVVNNHTNVCNISLKQFLSHIETKQELTIYLAKHFVSVMERIGKKYVVTYDQVTKTNINEYPRELLQNDHGEADTLIILHAIEVANRNHFCECIISSPDTDVFLLLIHFYENSFARLLYLEQEGGRKNETSMLENAMKPLALIKQKQYSVSTHSQVVTNTCIQGQVEKQLVVSFYEC